MNILAALRKIRQCDSETAAQVIFEHAIKEYQGEQGATNIRGLSSEELSHRFWECGRANAKAQREFFLLNENRKRLLDTLTLRFMNDDTKLSHAKALSKARDSEEFGLHLEGQAIAVENKYIADANFKECDFEIKRRLNASFAARQEFKAGSLVT